MQEKELEAELERKKESDKTPKSLSRLYSSALSEDSHQKIKELLEKYDQFDGWNLDTVDDKCLVYSSLTPQKLVARKNKGQFTSTNSSKEEASDQI